MKSNLFYILLALAEGPRHGSAIQNEARVLSDGAVRLWPATLYGSIEELVRLGWLEELTGTERPDGPTGRERFYRLTGNGRAALAQECTRLESMARMARARLAEPVCSA